jgi:hypothetical protein
MTSMESRIIISLLKEKLLCLLCVAALRFYFVCLCSNIVAMLHIPNYCHSGKRQFWQQPGESISSLDAPSEKSEK